MGSTLTKITTAVPDPQLTPRGQADGYSGWDASQVLAVPAAALLACCDWSSNSSSWDRSSSGSSGGGYPCRVPVLADAAAASIADNSMITAAGAAPGDSGRQEEEGGGTTLGLAKAKARAEAALRAARLVWTAVVISADYKAFDVSQVLAAAARATTP